MFSKNYKTLQSEKFTEMYEKIIEIDVMDKIANENEIKRFHDFKA